MSDGDSDSGKWTEIGPDPVAVVCMLIAVIAITIGILVNNNIREDAETDRWTACPFPQLARGVQEVTALTERFTADSPRLR